MFMLTLMLPLMLMLMLMLYLFERDRYWLVAAAGTGLDTCLLVVIIMSIFPSCVQNVENLSFLSLSCVCMSSYEIK